MSEIQIEGEGQTFSERETTLEQRVENLLNNNHRIGRLGDVDYDYTCPSPGAYPHQWLWDSSFHSIVLTHLDPDRAKREISTLLSKQQENGFVSCVSIWQKGRPFEELFYVTRITQPPVIPIAVETIYERTKDIDFVKDAYPKLKSFLNWLTEHRDRNGNGLIEIIHPWEDGDDGNPSFDKQLGLGYKPSVLRNFAALLRGLTKYSLMGWDEEKIFRSKTFISETVLFNSIYAKALLSMTRLAGLVGEEGDAAIFKTRYEATKKALIDLCWSAEDQIFYDLDQNSKQTGVKNTSSLMPLILPDLPESIAKPLIERHLLNENEFWTPFPIASVARDEKTFNPENSLILWRGPMWVNTNWFLAKGLRNYGYMKEADYLTQKTKEAVDKSGFREFYNPLTGEGCGQPN